MAELAESFKPVTPDELNAMSRAGFSDDEVHQFRLKSMQEMANAGFNEEEVRKYYGALEPDMEPTRKLIKSNLKLSKEEMAERKKQGPIDTSVPQLPAEGIMDAIAAGWGASVSGLIGHQRRPDIVLPEDADRAARIASQITQLAGDMPAMVAGWAGGATVGAAVGGAAGSVLPGIGTLGGIAVGGTVGGSAGAFAAPAAMRKALMDHYEKGDIKDFSDFWERSSAVLWEAAKQGTVGAVTGGAGVVAGKAIPAVAGPVVEKSAQAAAEIGAMVTVGKAIEGEMPNADDFIDAAIVVGGLHAVSKVGKFRTVYEKTGVKPEILGEMAEKDPAMKQELMSDNIQVPKALEKNIEEIPSPKAPESKPLERGDAEAAILEKIGVKAEKQKDAYTRNDFYKDYVDKLDPIKQLEIEGVGKAESGALPVAESPYKLARMVNDAPAKAKYAIEKGTFDFKTLEKTGKSLTEIIAPFKKDLNGLRAFLVAERAIEVEASGRKSGFDVEAAKKVSAEGLAKYGEAAQEIYTFQRNMLKYLRDSGRVSQKAYDAMLAKGEKYVPFGRILEEIEAGGEGLGTVLKEFKGSEKSIQDPFLTIVENTEKIMKIAERNRAMAKTVEFAEKFAPEELVKIESKGRSLKKNEIEIWRNGEREVYQGDKNLIEALRGLEGNAPTQNFLLKIARTFTTVKRYGITMTPDFVVKNFLRDTLTAKVFSKSGTTPIDVVVAMGDLFKKNDHYYNWLKSGGANGSFLELNARYLEKDVFKLDEQTGFIKEKLNVIRRPIEMLALMGNIVESAPRLAEFKKTSKRLGTLEGGFAAREITVDFQRVGAKMQALNAITAFQNVSIQGLDRTIRAVKDNPKDVGLKVSAYIVAPSVYLWWANHEDERYKEIPRWEKDIYWHIITDDWQPVKDGEDVAGLPEHMIRETARGLEINRGTIYRIPKPQELGMIGSLAERTLDAYVADNPGAYKDLGATLKEMVVPSLVPDVITPVAEHATKRNFFTDRPLVPTYLENEIPAMRYTEYTTETSKALGKILGSIPYVRETYGSSPMVIENYVRGWTGTLGMYALQLADAGLIATGSVDDPVKPAWTVADIPAVKSFVTRYPSAQAQSIQDFYDEADKAKMAVTSLRSQMRKGNEEEVEFVLSQYQDQLKNLDGYRQALSKQSQFIHAVRRQKDWTPEEKRQLIETTYYQMIEISRQGLEMSREMEKALKEQ